jgi:TolB protein
MSEGRKVAKRLTVIVVIVYVVTASLSDLCLEEFQVTTNERNQAIPAIYGDIVVWQDERNGNLDIYGYSLSTKEEFEITTDSSHQRSPAIYGNTVVWEDNRNGNWDIYGYNLSTKEEFEITTDINDQLLPAIYGNTVVWEDKRNTVSDIYGYDLSSKEEFQITSDESVQSYPRIFGNIIVWEDWRNAYLDLDMFKDENRIMYRNYDIYGYDLSTKEEFEITTHESNQEVPAIYGDIVVWQDNRNGNWDIYGYNLSTKEEFEITTDINNQRFPAIYGNTAVWEDERNRNRDIYSYNLLTGEEFQITADTNDRMSPAVYGSIITWQDTRNSNWDIYGAVLDIDSTMFFSHEADFFFEMGKKEYSEKNYEIALGLFQLAREKYLTMHSEEKTEECDEWSEKCQVELKKRIYLRNFLSLLFILFSILVLVKGYQKLGKRKLEYVWRKIHKGMCTPLEPHAMLSERPLGLSVLTTFLLFFALTILLFNVMMVRFYIEFIFYGSLFCTPSVWESAILVVYLGGIVLPIFLAFSCFGLWTGKLWSYKLFLAVLVSEIIRYVLSHLLNFFRYQIEITPGDSGVFMLEFLFLIVSMLYLRRPRVKEYLGVR